MPKAPPTHVKNARTLPPVPPSWSVQVYQSAHFAGWYAHLFTPSGKVCTWRNCFSRRGAILSLGDYAEKTLTGAERSDALRAVCEALEVTAPRNGAERKEP